VDVQGEFHSIKDSLQQLKLPASLRLNADRLNIRREDFPLLTVLQKAAKYSETTIKLIDALLAKNEDPSLTDMMQKQGFRSSFLATFVA
jgi:virulence-associated protein VagC